MRPIGSLISLLPAPSPSSSETTTSPREPSANPGPQAGGRGLTTTSAITAQGLGRALMQADPAQTDRSLEASLTLLLGSKPRPRERSLFPKTGGYVTILEGFNLPPMTSEARTKALETVRVALNPMTRNECIGLLGELKLLTVPRSEQATDMAAQLSLYARKLAEYPADVTRHVLESQPKMSKWWPTWEELYGRLELHTKRRRRLMEALDRPTPSAPTTGPQASPGADVYRTPPREPEMELTEADIASRKAEWRGVGDNA